MITQPLSSQTIHQIISTYNSQYNPNTPFNETSNTFALHQTTSTTPNPIESYTHFHKLTKTAFTKALPFPNPTLPPKHHQACITSFINDYITFNNQLPQTNDDSPLSCSKHLFLAHAPHVYDVPTAKMLQKKLQNEFNNSFVDNTSTVIDVPQIVQPQQEYMMSNEEDSESFVEDSSEVLFGNQNSNVNQEGGNGISAQNLLLQDSDIDDDDNDNGSEMLSDNTSTYD
jgi:hypothetical protein